MTKDKWIWLPHSAHFICAFDCRFHLATYVGKYIVSTIGELFPDSPVREIIATSKNIELVGKGDSRVADYMSKIGYSELGYERKYETMVFKAEKSKEPCCKYQIKNGDNLDFLGYNLPNKAYEGHMKLCDKWSKK